MAQKVYLFRHGETEWSITGRHTGLTDIPLTDEGRQNAQRIAPYLQNVDLAQVYTSPLQRARVTCNLAGVGDRAEETDLLVEWNYGDYEGVTTREIQRQRPDWVLFTDGCPNGETPEDVAKRADKIIEIIRNTNSDVAVFSHGDFLRVMAVRWLELSPAKAGHFVLSTTTLNILGYYHKSIPAVLVWNSPLP